MCVNVKAHFGYADMNCAVVVTDSDDVSFLNFARIIKQYIAPFFKLEPQTALQYAYLVMLNSDAPAPSGLKQRQLCLELVRDIVLSSRSWSRLLGSVRSDGGKETGMIERDLKLLKLEDEQDYLRQVVLAAADQSSLDSSLTDSIELYHLAGSYDKVVETVNRALGHSLSQTAGTAPLPSDAAQIGLTGAFGGAPDLYSLAQKVHAVYERDFGKRTRVSSLHWETLETLLQLKLALAQFAADRPDLALEVSELICDLDEAAADINNRHSRPLTSSRLTTTLHPSHATRKSSETCWTNLSSPTLTT